MKIAIVALSMTLMGGFPAGASSKTEACKNAGEAAKSVMRARQENADMSSLMERVDQQQESEAFKNIARKMIISAYKQPAYNNKEIQERAIADFSNDVQLACYQGMPD